MNVPEMTFDVANANVNIKFVGNETRQGKVKAQITDFILNSTLITRNGLTHSWNLIKFYLTGMNDSGTIDQVTVLCLSFE